MTYFCIIQNGTKKIYGIGTPEQSAWNDAKTWSDSLESMHCAKCSEAFCEYVKEHGGDFDFIEHDGRAYLLSEWEAMK